MKFWWWIGANPGNFGDIITPLILDYFKIPCEYSADDYEAISTGSIAKKAKDKTIVLGSGIMSLKDGLCPTADWRFVRGPITRQSILRDGGQCPEIYGDPAMLLPLVRESASKKYDVGLIPHWSQYETIKQRYPKHHVVNMRTDNPLKTLDEITQCRSVISSSLHGIITAHAYGIPAALVEFDYLKGDGMKFIDHYLAIDVDPILSTVKRPEFSLGKVDILPIVKIFENLSASVV